MSERKEIGLDFDRLDMFVLAYALNKLALEDIEQGETHTHSQKLAARINEVTVTDGTFRRARLVVEYEA